MKPVKMTHKRWLALVLALCVILGAGSLLCGCADIILPGIVPIDGKERASDTDTVGAAGKEDLVSDIRINDEGQLVVVFPDGRSITVDAAGSEKTPAEPREPGSLTVNQTTMNVTVEGDGTPDFSVAASRALLDTVSVYCTYTKTVRNQTSGFDFWFGFGSGSSEPTDYTYYSAGSGVIWKIDKTAGDAYILTNYHVVYDADCNTENHISDQIEVYLFGSEISGAGIRAEYVGGSMYYDLAVLKITGNERLQRSEATAAAFGDADDLSAGQWIMAVGNPEAEGISVTAGVVSVPSEYIEMPGADNRTAVSFRVIRVDAPVNSGNSGGGLYNAAGELIGIVNAKVSDNEVENIGYAIPSGVVRAICDNILYYCDGTDCECVRRGLLGITVSTADSRATFDEESALVGIEETILVHEVTEGGLADGKLAAGDRLISIRIGERVTTITRQYHVVDAMLDARAGDTVTVTFERDGEVVSCDMIVTEDCIAEY